MPKEPSSRPQKKAAKKKPAKAAVKKRSMRDVVVTPTIRQVEESIKTEGTTVSAAAFRTFIGW